MSRTTASPVRPELTVHTACTCRQTRCALTGPCLEDALTDGRYGLWTRGPRPRLRLAS